jgi:protocatechuate 3,4-dioxygenase beta subunit
MKDDYSRFPHLTRRGFLAAGGVALTASNAFPSTPGCSLTSEQEEGPYYIDDGSLRLDITEGKPGVPLILGVKLVNAKTCAPLPQAALDIWHCDASGVYSGFTSNSPDSGPRGGPGGRGPSGPPPLPFGPGMPQPGRGDGRPMAPPRSRQTDATRFLRGVQLTNGSGLVEFSTLYPGWYSGRAIHIHMKVHLSGAVAAKYAGGHVAHTGQLFFPEDLTERVAHMDPYAKRLAVHRTTQTEDDIFQSQHGAECVLLMERLGKTDRDGFRATATLAIDPEATPAPVGRSGGRGPGGPPR